MQDKQPDGTFIKLSHASQAGVRKLYLAPELTVYGSVRNLTGGSLGVKPDAHQTTRARN